jgi:hypothetical protein
MATEKWISGSGQGLTWGNAFTGTTLNSIASGNAIISDISITNGTALDMFADVSINLASLAAVAPNYVGVFLYPLNADASTYGDGRFTGVGGAAGPPASTYWVGNIVVVAATQAQEGTTRGIILPPGTFKFLLYNQCGAAFAASGNTCQYRTYNRSVA